MNKDLRSGFLNLYGELGFVPQDGNPRPLPRICELRESCWKGAETRIPADTASWTAIYQPWIGDGYSDLRLAIIGLNMNEYGGLHAMTGLVNSARSDIRAGCRRVRFGNDPKSYRGTLLFHRIGAYAALYAQAARLLHPDFCPDGFPGPSFVADAFDFIALTNHVKCSPLGDRSAPTRAMIENCGRHVLRRELEILRPREILVLGVENAWYLADRVLDEKVVVPTGRDLVSRGEGRLAGIPVRITAVPHPHARGYSIRSVLTQVRAALGLPALT
ncbi:MAG: uracil-DNA glycosylase family protein [bacterium]|nr:uracil-DNA glycosylase family protein [bacterium]